MGVDWYAKAIIGVKIAKEDTLESHSERGCEHPKRNGNFCPECGKKMWITTQKTRKEIADLDIEQSFNLIHSTDNRDLFVGILPVQTQSNRRGADSNKIELPDQINVADVKVRLKKVLGDLYKEENFGLWTVLYCSY